VEGGKNQENEFAAHYKHYCFSLVEKSLSLSGKGDGRGIKLPPFPTSPFTNIFAPLVFIA
jgi:hypothetical protein